MRAGGMLRQLLLHQVKRTYKLKHQVKTTDKMLSGRGK